VKPGTKVGTAVVVLGELGYRTPVWYAMRRQGVTASEISAVVGLSPYDSRFNLWWHKRLGEGGDESNAAQTRGRRIEPLVLEDWSDAHPDLRVRPVGLVQHVDRPYQLATPDGVAYEGRRGRTPVGVVEAKTAGGRQGWGEPGTDEIPDHYRCQVMWQMDTIGVRVAYVPVWFGFDFAEYVVEWDRADADWLRGEALSFLESLDRDESPPLDSHPETRSRLQTLHPTIQPGEVDVPEHVVGQYLAAKRLRDAAQDRMDLAENRLRAALGDFAIGIVPDPDSRQGFRKAVSRSVYDVKGGVTERRPYTVNKLSVRQPTRRPSRKGMAPQKGAPDHG
jgi:putative phage-type endonuclease